MENNTPHLSQEIEAILFVYGDAIKEEKLVKILTDAKKDTDKTSITREAVDEALVVLETRLTETNSALALMRGSEGVQLATRPFVKEIAQSLAKAEMTENLTPAALETLTIIAYTGPVSRNTIDYIRGVNSSFILRALLIRGLIERSADPARPNAYQYAPSIDFLKHLGITNVAALPEYEVFKKAVEAMQAHAATKPTE